MKTLKNTKKSDSIALFREMSYRQSELITGMFGWTEEQYFDHQMDEYEAFLKRLYWGRPVEAVNRVRYSKVFAGFWKSEWVSRTMSDILPFAEDLLAEGMMVNACGELEVMKPSEEAMDTVHDEYLYVHSHRRLIMDENFMGKYFYILKLIQDDKN